MNSLSWSSINLEPTLIDLFHHLLENHRLAHAYIFHGPKNINKQRVALEFAKAINCEQNQTDACDQCATCLKIDHHNHPDVTTISPEGTGIKIDQLRELKKKFHYQAAPGMIRIVIIEEADQMRSEAANSLLKFLEDPPSPMVAILLTERIQSILPTIQSRCQKIRFGFQFTRGQVSHYQEQGFPFALAQIAAQLSYPVQMDADSFRKCCLETIEWFNQIRSNQHAEMMITLLQIVQNRPEQVVLYLDMLLFWVRDLLHFQITGDVLVFTDWADRIKGTAHTQTKERLLLMSENVMIARRLLDKPGIRHQAVLEQMIFAIQQNQISHDNGWQLIVI